MIYTLDMEDPRERAARTTSVVGTVLLHVTLFLMLSFLTLSPPKPAELIELEWGASSGAPNQSTVEAKAETQRQVQRQPKPAARVTEKKKVELPRMKSSSEETIPIRQKARAARAESRTEPSKVKSSSSAEKSERSQPAGAGKTTGYSIEWSGIGSRKLLSGRMPRYPEGADKEMPVLLQFTVLPDGSVMGIIPLRRSDELLEREAISALRTWRFDPLPQQFEQTPQVGKVTFNFVLE